MPDVKTPKQLLDQLSKAAVNTAISTDTENRLKLIREGADDVQQPIADQLIGNAFQVTGQTPTTDLSSP